MLVAQASRLRGSFLDVEGIFYNFVTEGPPYRVPMSILAKVRIDPTEAGDQKSLTFSILKVEGESFWGSIDWLYACPTFDDWLRDATPIIRIRLPEIEYTEPGEYVVELREGEKLLAQEWFKITDSREE